MCSGTSHFLLCMIMCLLPVFFFSFPEDLDEEVYLVSYTIFYDIQDHLIRIILNNNRNKCGNR